MRALADFSLAANARIRAAERAGREPRTPVGSGPMHAALRQRAVRERQRLAGGSARAADDAVTAVINHVGHLDERAAWFGADSRLRETAIDETLRRALLAEPVPSEPAQRGLGPLLVGAPGLAAGRPASGRPPGADPGSRALAEDWLLAWAAWAATA